MGQTGRNFLIGLNEVDGKKKKNRILKGERPLSPVRLGNHVLVAYGRKGRGVVTMLKGKSLKRQWHHIVDSAVEEPLTLDETKSFLYFKTKKHLHRLRLFEKPYEGKRKKSVSWGDFRTELPAPTSRFLLTATSLYMTALDEKDGRITVLSLPVGLNSGRERFTARVFKERHDDAGDVGGAAAPIVQEMKCYIPLGQFLYILQRQPRDSAHKIRYPAKIVDTTVHAGKLFIVLADGRIYSGMLPE